MIVKDPGARAWIDANSIELDRQLEAFKAKTRVSKDEKKVLVRSTCLRTFCGSLKRLPNEVIADCKQSGGDPVDYIDNLVTYLVSKHYASLTIRNYPPIMQIWFRFNKIKIDHDELEDRVELPRAYKQTEDELGQ